MGKGGLSFLNKKSWHTATIANSEKVWLAEEKDRAEKLKLDQWRKEIAEERQVEEMRAIQRAHGIAKNATERLDWMYRSAEVEAEIKEKEKEEFLLGKEGTGLVRGSQSLPQSAAITGPITSADAWVDKYERRDNAAESRIREDPMLMIMQQEQNQRLQVLKNPIQMKRLREEVKLVKKLKKLEEKEKKRARKEEKRRLKSAGGDGDADPTEKQATTKPVSVADRYGLINPSLQDQARVFAPTKPSNIGTNQDDNRHRDRRTRHDDQSPRGDDRRRPCDDDRLPSANDVRTRGNDRWRPDDDRRRPVDDQRRTDDDRRRPDDDRRRSNDHRRRPDDDGRRTLDDRRRPDDHRRRPDDDRRRPEDNRRRPDDDRRRPDNDRRRPDDSRPLDETTRCNVNERRSPSHRSPSPDERDELARRREHRHRSRSPKGREPDSDEYRNQTDASRRQASSSDHRQRDDSPSVESRRPKANPTPIVAVRPVNRRRPHPRDVASTATRGLTAEQRAARIAEMQNDAKEQLQVRKVQLERDQAIQAVEEETLRLRRSDDAEQSTFIQGMKTEAFMNSADTIEDRINQRKHYRQKGNIEHQSFL